jgi:hypothetical protein
MLSNQWVTRTISRTEVVDENPKRFANLEFSCNVHIPLYLPDRPPETGGKKHPELPRFAKKFAGAPG